MQSDITRIRAHRLTLVRDTPAAANAPAARPREETHLEAQAFPSEFDAGGVVNKARSQNRSHAGRPCNSEIARNGPFIAGGEIHTDMRQLPAKTKSPPR